MQTSPTIRKVNGEKKILFKKIQQAYPTLSRRDQQHKLTKIWDDIRTNHGSHKTTTINIDKYKKVMVDLNEKKNS